jgi:hypothetical protein
MRAAQKAPPERGSFWKNVGSGGNGGNSETGGTGDLVYLPAARCAWSELHAQPWTHEQSPARVDDKPQQYILALFLPLC